MEEQPKFRRIDSSSGYRFYEVFGCGTYPSVTTILKVPNKPALVPWAAKEERKMVLEAAALAYSELPKGQKLSEAAFMTLVGDRIGLVKAYKKEMTKASDIGTEVHNKAEWHLKTSMNLEAGPEPILSTEAAKESFKKYEKYLADHHFKPLQIERTVWSVTYAYAGTQDWLAYLDGVLTVGDWKTSKSMHGEYLLQIAALVTALRELDGITEPIQGCAVRLPKTEEEPEPEFKIISFEEIQELTKTFLGFRQAFDWYYKNDMDGQQEYRDKKKREKVRA